MKTLVLTVTALAIAQGVLAADTKSVLGRYGQTVETTKIYRAPNSQSRAYYTAKAFEYICVNWYSNPKWLKVLMSNGTQGYVPSAKVAVLPYEVTVSRTSNTRSKGLPLASTTSRGAVAQWSLNFIGTPYKWGGNDIQNGIDCSAFVQKLYGEIGLKLPRTASEQAMVGQPIERLEELQKGDRLYFWENRRWKIGHTGIYLGNGYFVHSSSGKKGVSTDFLSERWRKILVAARR